MSKQFAFKLKADLTAHLLKPLTDSTKMYVNYITPRCRMSKHISTYVLSGAFGVVMVTLIHEFTSHLGACRKVRVMCNYSFCVTSDYGGEFTTALSNQEGRYKTLLMATTRPNFFHVFPISF